MGVYNEKKEMFLGENYENEDLKLTPEQKEVLLKQAIYSRLSNQGEVGGVEKTKLDIDCNRCGSKMHPDFVYDSSVDLGFQICIDCASELALKEQHTKEVNKNGISTTNPR